jgi:hypothetical protein
MVSSSGMHLFLIVFLLLTCMLLMFLGITLRIPLTRKKICPICHGKGGIEGGLVQCPHCGHTHAPGRHVVHDKLGNVYSQQNEKTCHVCQGHGEGNYLFVALLFCEFSFFHFFIFSFFHFFIFSFFHFFIFSFFHFFILI